MMARRLQYPKSWRVDIRPRAGQLLPAYVGFSVDALLGSTVLYTVVIAYSITVYMVVLSFVQFFDGSNPMVWVLSLCAVVIIALTVRPVHQWVRRGVNQIVYGRHDNPYGAITRLNQSLEAASSPYAIIPTIAATIADTLRLPYIAIDAETEGRELSAEYGVRPQQNDIVSVPLTYQTRVIGTLYAGVRRQGEMLSASDMSLLHDLAHQVGIALYAAQLNDALQASRKQLVTAREEERRRIRRDLHDGLGPTLASLRLQLGAVQRMVRQDPAGAEALIDELRDDVRATTAEIRRLVYGLRPPMLDEFGLVGAIRNLSLTAEGVVVELSIPEELPDVGAAVEVALYRVISEALLNVVKHAEATYCHIRLDVEPETLHLTIVDNGIGLPENVSAGIGMVAMRERTLELGGQLSIGPNVHGGTYVTAHIPFTATAL